jgi:hypothetical protein
MIADQQNCATQGSRNSRWATKSPAVLKRLNLWADADRFAKEIDVGRGQDGADMPTENYPPLRCCRPRKVPKIHFSAVLYMTFSTECVPINSFFTNRK